MVMVLFPIYTSISANFDFDIIVDIKYIMQKPITDPNSNKKGFENLFLAISTISKGDIIKRRIKHKNIIEIFKKDDIVSNFSNMGLNWIPIL